jgi:AMP deaminase
MQVVGFDLVDDESKPERRPTKHMPTPEHWDIVHNPAYAYYAYYVYANLCTLNMV